MSEKCPYILELEEKLAHEKVMRRKAVEVANRNYRDFSAAQSKIGQLEARIRTESTTEGE